MFAIVSPSINKETKTNDAFDGEINRVAVDNSGRIGLLYDGHRDRILEQQNIFNLETSTQIIRSIRCTLTKTKSESSQNILKIIGVEPELRLSILLNLTKKIESFVNIDHSHPINEYTRSIVYSYLDREEKIADSPEVEKLLNKPLILDSTATHVITQVVYGTDFSVILQLPNVWNFVEDIDRVLNKLLTLFKDQQKTCTLTEDDKNILDKIVETKVYSNIPQMRNITTIYDIYRYIQQNKNTSSNYPISYSIRPIKIVNPQYDRENEKFIRIPREIHAIIEDYVVQIRVDMEQIEKLIARDITDLSRKHLKKQFGAIENRWLDVKNKFDNEIQQISKLVLNIRSGKIENIMSHQILNHSDQIMMITNLNGLKQNIEQIKAKETFIRYMNQREFQYLNAAEYKIGETDDGKLIKYKLVENDENTYILCSSDRLNENNSEKLQSVISDLMERAEKNSNSRLIYADFSDCTFQLSSITILLPPKDTQEKTIEPAPSSSPQSAVEPDNPISNSMNADRLNAPETLKATTIDETINILLLGETGVGKSTFINAFANYLTFETLDEAETDKPFVLMPVSFLITTGDNFEEHTVEFGGLTDSSNEDFSHAGQSVTQRCKSYTFQMGDTYQTELRIIDTPGFGDTRGSEQDDMNMQHILEYINNLTHINAICFLLKPNSTKLNIFFLSCLTQLFSLLDSNALNNIIFCFTSARSTFYTPGDTAPLLKKMLTSLSIGSVPFKKENTFCFDSEAFRYLVARQNKIQFDNNEKQEYEMSWKTSVSESKRLVDYIRKDVPVYRIEKSIQSMKHAQFEILDMARPILETIRNILRNLILQKMTSFKVSIILRPKVNLCSGVHCLVCKPDLYFVGTFPVAYHPPHIVQQDRCGCGCPLDQHTPMDYVLQYEVSNDGSIESEKQMSDMLYELCYSSAEFAYFLLHVVCCTNDDPFFIGFAQMIAEECDITNRKMSSQLNTQLADDLRQLGKRYEERLNEIVQQRNPTNLSDLYNLMNNVARFPMVREQIAVVKVGRKIMMKQHEYEIPIE
ncbi:unnamed protein product [Rotaria socialis]|uniref:G domain-containing protein n=1 Tax=Rotaria socialis TaxID=392032 RepID=A0A817TZK2_9BILA|nr:unnamed protein product [Rotaria socialis]CAF4508893.1 unnamed protein product [Rotaria socialis]